MISNIKDSAELRFAESFSAACANSRFLSSKSPKLEISNWDSIEDVSKDPVFKKFVSIYGLLKSGVSPYSNRFLEYWDKAGAPNRTDDVIPARTRKGTVSFEDAWQLLTAFCFATQQPREWSHDIPALVTHWIQHAEDTRTMIDNQIEEAWSNLLRTFSRSASGFRISNLNSPLRNKRKEKFRFIDLFAGIGGFRIPLQELGGRCVFSSEWDQKARETYFQNYGEWPFGDITHFTGDHSVAEIPPFIGEHDILAGGFPCQPFSQAGQKLGFDDARGTLFFDILKIAKERRPKVLFLENVKGLRGHNKGHTFRLICEALYDINYKVYSKILTAKDFGVPQNRQRIFIVAFRDPIQFRFPRPIGDSDKLSLNDILEDEPDECFTISDRMWKGHVDRKARHVKNGNGFGYSLFDSDAKYVNTISARYWKDGSEILINQPDKPTPRTLTPRECARLQGFPDEFMLHGSKKSNYKQFGNSVAVPVIRSIAKEIIRSLKENRPAIDTFDKYDAIHN